MNEDQTKNLCHITSQEICKTLGVSYDVSEGQEFTKESFPLVYKQMNLENRVDKLTKLVKPNQTLEGIIMPYPNHIFHPKV